MKSFFSKDFLFVILKVDFVENISKDFPISVSLKVLDFLDSERDVTGPFENHCAAVFYYDISSYGYKEDVYFKVLFFSTDFA